MKLLITTQAVDKNDSNLGFFHEWIAEFAKHCEKVTVICLREGTHTLPDNVKVLSLGKEAGTGRLTRIARFFKYIWRYKNEYEAVFVHMNPEYVLLGSFLWHRWHKKISLWYAHGSVTKRLRKAVLRADIIFSVSPASFRVPTPKLRTVGHGIDTELFKPGIHQESTHLRIVTTGRVSPSKHLLEMLTVLDELYAQGEKFDFTVIGEPVSPQEENYAKLLRSEIAKRPYATRVRLIGSIPHRELPALVPAQDIFFNFSTTGNMDKAGLEALAAGVPVLTTNDAFKNLLSPCGLYVESRTPKDIANALEKFMNRPDRAAVVATLRNKVVAEHALQNLVPRILGVLIAGS